MRVSVNEVELTLKRAAAGAGWPWGLAEDIGRAAARAALLGLPQALAEALAAIEAGFAPPEGRRRAEGWQVAGPTATAAPAALDLLLAAGGAAPARLAAVDAPALLVGFASLAAELAGWPVSIMREDGTCAVVGPGTLTPAGALPAKGAAVTLARGTAEASATPPMAEGIATDEALWARALALAARSYVPASAQSRLRGAGAGLTDND